MNLRVDVRIKTDGKRMAVELIGCLTVSYHRSVGGKIGVEPILILTQFVFDECPFFFWDSNLLILLDAKVVLVDDMLYILDLHSVLHFVSILSERVIALVAGLGLLRPHLNESAERFIGRTVEGYEAELVPVVMLNTR